jgi:gliding motility-associated-like protein
VIVVDLINPIALCHDTTIYLSATGVATLLLADVEAGSSDNCSFTSSINNQTSISYTCPQIGNDTVQLIITDNSGNTAQCAAMVSIVDTISPTAICQNDTLYFSGTTLNINAASLDDGSFDNCVLQSFALSQDTFNCPDIGVNAITLTVTDSEGNSSACIANVTILDTTAVAIAGSTQLLCVEDSTILGATIPPSPLVGTWSSNSGATIANPNAANTIITNIPVGTTIFYWTLSNATCTSLSTDSVLIEVVPASPDLANAGIDQNLCQETTTTLGASIINVSTGEWLQTITQSNAGVVITDPTDTLVTISGLIPGNAYTFVWELTNGFCGIYANDTVIVTVDEIPNDQADGGADVICSPDTIHLAASFSIMGGIGQWSCPSTAFVEDSSSATSMASNFAQDTTMMIWSLSNGVCVDYSSDTMYVILDDVWPVSTADYFNLIPDGTISTIDVILNDALPPNWDIFIQSPMIGGQMTNLHNGQFEVDLNNVVLNQYFVYEICNTNCPDICDTALARIAIQPPGDCYTPTAFTPNNDGKNDFFVIPCLQNTNEKAGLAIFNRWGSLVFKTDKYTSDWDGTHQNQPLPDGVYFYILQIEEKTPQNGSIEIKR